MTVDLSTLRARVKAARQLAAAATPGPWIVHPRSTTSGWGTCVGPPGEMISRMTGGRGSTMKQRIADAAMPAAAPDLVGHLADALALAESQATDLADIRAALRLPALTPWPDVLARARTLAERDPARTLDDEGPGGGDGGGR